MNIIGSDERSRKINWNVRLSLLLKVWIAAVTFLQVPLVLNCLGEYQNGVWLTISMILVWIDVMDIGLGNGLRNRLSEALARNDHQEARRITSSAFAMLSVIMLPAVLLMIACIQITDVYALLNVDPALIKGLPDVLVVSVVMVGATFVFKFIGNVYMGLQLPAVSNVIQTVGLTMSLVMTWMLSLTGTATLWSIALVNTSMPLLAYLLAYPYTFLHKYPYLAPSFGCINWQTARSLFSLGARFFLVQLGALFLFASSNVLISRLYSPACVTPYQIAYRYMSLLVTAFSILAMPLWSATTDAYARNDMEWIRKTNHRMRLWTMVFVALYVLMLPASFLFYRLWIGSQTTVPFSYTALTGVYVLIVVFSTRYAYFLNGVGALRLQIIMTFVDAVLFVVLSTIVASMTDNLNMFIVVLSITQLPGLVVNRMQFKRIVSGNANGIWRIV